MTEQQAKAILVWDGGETINVPPQMGTPKADQLTGSVGEQVMELAARVCYDSLGAKKSRSTEANLKHLLDVGHLSTAEHFNRTVQIDADRGLAADIALTCLNRPGVWVAIVDSGVRITTNARAVLEWGKFQSSVGYSFVADDVGVTLQKMWATLMPLVIQQPTRMGPKWVARFSTPIFPQEEWVSFYLSGSRGFSHEMVRHGDFTAISQRSTRYVDEDESSWDWHPLILVYLNDSGVPMEDRSWLGMLLNGVDKQSQRAYQSVVSALQPWLKDRMEAVDPNQPWLSHTARKQARGAARGFLGNALRTDMIFSASVAQWQHIVRMRAADAADGEIRVIIAEVLNLLKSCRYGTRFDDMQLAPAADGVGLSLIDGGAK